MSRAERPVALKEAYGQLYSEVSRLIREADPVHLIAVGAPDDEYDPEVSTILPRLRAATSRNDVHRIVHEEFAHWFGTDIAGPAETYAAVSEDIWNVWQQSAARPNRGAPLARSHGRARAKHTLPRHRRGR